ncbi:anti-sigma regulatory factor [Lysinibacillus endophyticus]|uniref:ATP-binding protein n=1 Tax=Ureibacillus endophyticus TaxID=1978490 RepID=A0A494ZAH7_9BACL|nr:anti-sigma regulatory factor [Lysinibacillus endophyticus]MCP1146265.1 anti-sigma regulatory factor [Lysinibacillus endophyticus]RKQ19611.1 ATP-binding protein [Lysinibacillus endophyticus]
MDSKSTVEIITELDIVAARRLGRDKAREIGFNKVDQARITTAISELAKNIFLYAHVGKIVIEKIEVNEKTGIGITAIDRGPGIQEVRKVLEDRYRTPDSVGAGLPAVKRLVDSINIQSKIGLGTKIKVVKWLNQG